MSENKENRINVEDLPAAETELTAEEAKSVKGGLNFEEIKCTIKAADGSVKPQDITIKKVGG